MSYEEALAEWKLRDPYMLDFEGFQRFLEEKDKEVPVILEVGVSKGWGQVNGYQIWVMIPYEEVPEEYRERDDKEAKEIEWTIETLRRALKNIGLNDGMTKVFRQGDKWYYSGDFQHLPKENIEENAKILWNLWKTVGYLVDGAYGCSKAYDDTLYIDVDPQEHKSGKELPPFLIIGYDPQVYIGQINNIYKEPILPLETEETAEPIWGEISVLAKVLWLADLKDEPNWTVPEGEPFPIGTINRKSIPEVMNYLAKGRERWAPEESWELERQGGLEMVHPFLRKEMVFAWKPEEVVWTEEAEAFRDMYYHRYTLEELEPLKVDDLKRIAISKNINPQQRKDELITAILEANSSIITEVTPETEPAWV